MDLDAVVEYKLSDTFLSQIKQLKFGTVDALEHRSLTVGLLTNSGIVLHTVVQFVCTVESSSSFTRIEFYPKFYL